MRYAILSILFFIISSYVLHAQGDINDEQRALIRNERSFHLSLNSNGWGGGFTYGKMNNIYRKERFSAELVIIKDSKEHKRSNPYQSDLRRFTYGKNNIFYNLRLGYGHLFKLYSKKDKGGIEVRWYYNVGPSLGLLKPVYFVTSIEPYETERFDPHPHSSQEIYGGAPYFKGFGELKPIPGAFAKVGASFEFSKRDLLLNALEGGLIFDVFPKKIDLMANDNKQFYFLAIFVSYRFGKIINPRAIPTKPQDNE
ncbi:MAG: hypothetical protein PF517_12620 [Salinivirgaceae bacterium]|jgi:hypothetical protein|nr:hypothetical protein [Salinivirgaceae bacterium]